MAIKNKVAGFCILLLSAVILCGGFAYAKEKTLPDLVVIYTGDVRGKVKCAG